MVIYSRTAWAVAAALLLAPALSAQAPLTLGAALARADAGAYANRMAAGRAREGAARADAALRGILPTIRVEAGWMRTDDPVAVFGLQLRQRTISAADFDPATLNNPAARSDVSTGAVLEVPLLNPDAWLGRSAARSAAAASEASARWTRGQTRTDVVRAYYGALLAAEKVATLRAAVQAARDHVRQAEAMAGQGLATRSDALLADVKTGELEADLAGASADAALARAGLALLLGAPEDTAFTLPDALPSAEQARAVAGGGAGTSAPRADVEAARLALGAARADRRRAASLLLPRINAFGRSDWHDRSALGGGSPMWTVGLLAQWSPFAGASEIAERGQAAGRLEAADAAADAADASARLDIARRDADLAVALQRLDIAEHAVAQAAEAHRIVSRKYDGGLATVVELLDASAAETATRLRHVAARYDVIVATAARLQAHGLTLDILASLDR